MGAQCRRDDNLAVDVTFGDPEMSDLSSNIYFSMTKKKKSKTSESGEKPDVNAVRRCDQCHKEVNIGLGGEANWQQHLASKAHVQNVKALEASSKLSLYGFKVEGRPSRKEEVYLNSPLDTRLVLSAMEMQAGVAALSNPHLCTEAIRDIYEHRLDVPEPFLRVVKRERESPELVDWPARDRRAPFESPPRLTHYRDVPTSPRVCPKGELLSRSPTDYLQEAWVPDISAPQTVVKAVGEQLNGLTSAHEPQDQYTSPRRPSPVLQSDALQ
ncbi:hypothetical protein BDW22DRAFT_1354224 [Trametopsis cervina]|nr:hypothetical protein BDW22DRAFT_1354224 [Trametopsis cervina]